MFIKINPKSNFTILPNAVINSDISLFALGLYAKMRSKPNNWIFNPKLMAKECKVNIQTFYKYLKELYNNKLIERVQKKENGRFTSEVNYIFNSGECLESEVNINDLSMQQVESLKREITQISKCENLKNQESQAHNNNIYTKKEIEKEKEKEKNKKEKSSFALIDLATLLKQCDAYIAKHKAKDSLIASEFAESLNDYQKEVYNEYIAYRSARKKLSKSTIKHINNKFLSLIKQGEDVKAVVERTILNGWTGLFAIHANKQSYTGYSNYNAYKGRSNIAKHNDSLESLNSQYSQSYDKYAELEKIVAQHFAELNNAKKPQS